jgi:hypothetical protein
LNFSVKIQKDFIKSKNRNALFLAPMVGYIQFEHEVFPVGLITEAHAMWLIDFYSVILMLLVFG